MAEQVSSETYKYFVVSYLESASPYYSKYRSDDGHSSKFYTVRCYDENEVKDNIYNLELNECLIDNYILMDYFRYDHYIYTSENLFGPTYDEYGDYIDYDGYEMPKAWQEEIIGRVNGELVRIENRKRAKAIEEKQKRDIIKEQEEKRQYEELRKKYGNFDPPKFTGDI